MRKYYRRRIFHLNISGRDPFAIKTSRLKYYLLFLLNSPVENEWFQFRYVTRFRLEELIECGGGFLGAKQVLASSRFSSTVRVSFGRNDRMGG